MTDGWLDPGKYERVPITGCTGPGTMHDGYAWKFVGHTTESPGGSMNGVIALFKAQPCSCPQLILDPATGRRVQCIPWTWSACALRGGAGGWQTNRGRAVQMEICAYSQDAPAWPDSTLWQIADVVADLIKDGCPINLDHVPDYPAMTGTTATARAPQRMSWQQWQAFDGLGAHIIVPNNDHYDWHRANGRRIAQLAKEILAGAGYTFVPKALEGPLPPAPAAVQPAHLQKGMTGGQVKFVQELLVGLGYNPGPVDGVFGFATEQAVRAFQGDAGLVVDGVVGPATCAAISSRYAPLAGQPAITAPAPAQSGAPAWPGRYLVLQQPLLSGGDVRTWQNQMAARGWRLEADGYYGTQSYGTCKSFQFEKGLTADGVVGPQTWQAAWSSLVT